MDLAAPDRDVDSVERDDVAEALAAIRRPRLPVGLMPISARLGRAVAHHLHDLQIERVDMPALASSPIVEAADDAVRHDEHDPEHDRRRRS